MNKSIIALIAAVFIIGAALVIFNQQQTPEPRVEAERNLPALPTPEPSQTDKDLQPLPKLPAPITNEGASVRAPVAQEGVQEGAQEGVQETAQKNAAPEAAEASDKAQTPSEGTKAAVAQTDTKKDAAAEKLAVQEGTRPAAQPAREAAKADARPEAKPEQKAAEKPAKKPAALAEKRQAEEKAKPAVDTTVQPKITVYSRENGATVRVRLPAAIRYRQQRLTSPERIVIDINGQFRNLRAPGVPANPLVTNVRLGLQSNNTTRVVVDLKEKPRRERVILSEDLQQLDIRVDQ